MQALQRKLAHLVSFWVSEEDLTSVTGMDDYEVIKPSPEEKNFLVAYESTAGHYYVVYSSEDFDGY